MGNSAETTQSSVHFDKIAQIAITVHDIEATAQKYADIFGLPVPNIITTSPGDGVNMTYRGQPSNAQAKL